MRPLHTTRLFVLLALTLALAACDAQASEDQPGDDQASDANPATIEFDLGLYHGDDLLSEPTAQTLEERPVSLTSSSQDDAGDLAHEVEFELIPTMVDDDTVQLTGHFKHTPAGGETDTQPIDEPAELDYALTLYFVTDDEPFRLDIHPTVQP